MVSFGLLVNLFQSQPWTLIVFVGLIAWGVWAILKKRKENQSNFESGLLTQANILENWAEHGLTDDAPFALAKGEKFVYSLNGIQLAEYTSTGSSYSGTNLGVSVPVFGRVRANVGGSQGQLTKNPAALNVIDTGQVSFTNQRVIFTGAQQTRVWDFSKILNQTLGANGSTLTIAAANKAATSTLIQPNTTLLGPGVIYGIAFDAHKEGGSVAPETARLYAKQLREGVAAQRAAKK